LPALANPRHEAYAQEIFAGIAEGRTQREAYRRSGYRPQNVNSNDAAASRLRKRVIARVVELQHEAARAKRVTVESVIGELDEARDLALEQKQPNAMVAATSTKAKIAGLFVDKVETGEPGAFKNVESLSDLAFSLLESAMMDSKGHIAGNITQAQHDEALAELRRHLARIDEIATGSHLRAVG
jgi:hypothetical protein